MKTFKQKFEKDYFSHLYAAFEKRDNERGFGKLIHLISVVPENNDEFTNVLPFEEMLDYLVKNNLTDMRFFGPPVYYFQHAIRFKWFVKNRGLDIFFEDMSDNEFEAEVLGEA